MVSKMRRYFIWVILFLAFLSMGSIAHAQSTPEGSRPQRLDPQQREQVKEKLRSRWQAMNPQERDEAKLKLKQRFQSLSPAQRQKLLERWRQRAASSPR